MASSHVDIIINPVSGRSGTAARLAELCDHLKFAGFTTSCTYTRGPGDARRAAEQLREKGCRALVVVGGDGTIREAATGLAAADSTADSPPILILASGTENLLARYLKLPADPKRLADLLPAGREVPVDVLHVYSEAEAAKFLIVAGIGFDAEVVRALSASRRGHIDYASYFWPIWRTLCSYNHPRLTVEADGKIIHEGPGLAFVGGLPRYALGMRILDRSGAADGLLDVCVFECRHLGQLVRHSLNVLLRRHPESSGCAYTRAAKIIIRSDQPAGIQLDGDWAMGFPLRQPGRPAQCMTFQSTGRQVRFLAPAN
jgi:YegS/Rv2252/BmrU family lipid kinase